MGRKKMFDFCIGNPGYQSENDSNGRQPPVYHLFMDAAEKVGQVVELITPARFLFNAGQTPKDWNKKKLNDPHFKVLKYIENATSVFPNTDIKGGVAITLRDDQQNYGAIKTFTAYAELNTIVRKVGEKTNNGHYLDSIISSRGTYRTTETFFKDFPSASKRLGKGTGNMIASNFFEKIPEANVQNDPSIGEKIKFLARVKNKRVICALDEKYVQKNNYIDFYNVACPKSNGSGKFGETLTTTEILVPKEGATDTFINMGRFKTKIEASNLQRYISTKFFRALLGVKKVTQDNPKSVWGMIPLQDFSANSDIDWSKSIHDIDLQLYKKYGLSTDEIKFIESHVKEMA